MRKTGRKARREGMSAGRVEYIEAARRRARNRRLRRTAVLVALVAAVVIYLTGIVNTSVMVLEDLTDSARIALSPRQGFPQQTGAGDVYQAESLGGSFVVLGAEGCAVFAEGGARLNTVGAGGSCGSRAAPASCTPGRRGATSSSAPSAAGESWRWPPTTPAASPC